MPLGTTAAILLGIGAAGAGIAASQMAAPKSQPNQPLPLPQPPSPTNAQDTAGAIGRNRTNSMTQTIFTGPLGVQDQANITKKVLLGQ